MIAMADHVFDRGLHRARRGARRPPGEVVALIERDVEQVYDLAAAVKVTLADEPGAPGSRGDRITAIGDLPRYDRHRRRPVRRDAGPVPPRSPGPAAPAAARSPRR